MKDNVIENLICPVCKNRLSLSIFKGTKNEIQKGVLKCSSCKKQFKIINSMLVFRDDRRQQKFKEETKRFFQKKSSHKYDADTVIGREINNFSDKQCKDSVFLDFGGGDGQATENLKFKTMLHVDNALSAYHNKAISIIADGENLPFKNGSVDCGISINVFHHTEGWDGIKEISRVLKPGGCFLFIDKTGDNPIANLCYRLFKYMPKQIKLSIENEDLSEHGTPIKIRMFRHNSMENACRSYGLKPIRIERTKIFAWFSNYIERFFPIRISSITKKMERILIKTPAKVFCFETIIEVKKEFSENQI